MLSRLAPPPSSPARHPFGQHAEVLFGLIKLQLVVSLNRRSTLLFPLFVLGIMGADSVCAECVRRMLVLCLCVCLTEKEIWATVWEKGGMISSFVGWVCVDVRVWMFSCEPRFVAVRQLLLEYYPVPPYLLLVLFVCVCVGMYVRMVMYMYVCICVYPSPFSSVHLIFITSYRKKQQERPVNSTSPDRGPPNNNLTW